MKLFTLILLIAELLTMNESCSLKYHFSFGLLERPPGLFFKTQTKNLGNGSVYDGTAFLVLDWLEKKLDVGISSIILSSNITVVGQPKTGGKNWDGAIGKLLRKDFDILGPALVATHARGQILDWVGLFYDDDKGLATPPATEESGVFAILDPFCSTIWIMFFASLFGVACCLTLIQKALLKKAPPNAAFTFNDVMLHLLGIALNQGETVYLSQRLKGRVSLNLAIASWGLLTLVLVNLYGSILVSHLTTRKRILPPQDSMAVLDQGVWSYLVQDDGIGREILFGAKSGPAKRVGDFLRRHPENFVATSEEAFMKVTSGCCAFSESIAYLEYRTNLDFEETGKCRVYVGGRHSGFISGYAIVKRNHLREKLNLSFLELYQTGIYKYWVSWFSAKPVCAMQWKEIEKVSVKRRTLSLRDFRSTFFIYGIGVLLSLLLLALENFRILPVCRRKRKTTVKK